MSAETKYYQKSIITSPLPGVPPGVSWYSLGDGSGIAEVSNPEAIVYLDQKIKLAVGGISPLTAEDYAKKKSEPVKPRRRVTEVPMQSIRADNVVLGADPAVGSSPVADFKPESSKPEPRVTQVASAPRTGVPPAGISSTGAFEEP